MAIDNNMLSKLQNGFTARVVKTETIDIANCMLQLIVIRLYSHQ